MITPGSIYLPVHRLSGESRNPGVRVGPLRLLFKGQRLSAPFSLGTGLRRYDEERRPFQVLSGMSPCYPETGPKPRSIYLPVHRLSGESRNPGVRVGPRRLRSRVNGCTPLPPWVPAYAGTTKRDGPSQVLSGMSPCYPETGPKPRSIYPPAIRLLRGHRRKAPRSCGRPGAPQCGGSVCSRLPA